MAPADVGAGCRRGITATLVNRRPSPFVIELDVRNPLRCRDERFPTPTRTPTTAASDQQQQPSQLVEVFHRCCARTQTASSDFFKNEPAGRRLSTTPTVLHSIHYLLYRLVHPTYEPLDDCDETPVLRFDFL